MRSRVLASGPKFRLGATTLTPALPSRSRSGSFRWPPLRRVRRAHVCCVASAERDIAPRDTGTQLSPSDTDYLALYTADATHVSAFEAVEYTDGRGSGSVVMTLPRGASGAYRVWYVTCHGHVAGRSRLISARAPDGATGGGLAEVPARDDMVLSPGFLLECAPRISVYTLYVHLPCPRGVAPPATWRPHVRATARATNIAISYALPAGCARAGAPVSLSIDLPVAVERDKCTVTVHPDHLACRMPFAQPGSLPPLPWAVDEIELLRACTSGLACRFCSAQLTARVAWAAVLRLPSAHVVETCAGWVCHAEAAGSLLPEAPVQAAHRRCYVGTADVLVHAADLLPAAVTGARAGCGTLRLECGRCALPLGVADVFASREDIPTSGVPCPFACDGLFDVGSPLAAGAVLTGVVLYKDRVEAGAAFTGASVGTRLAQRLVEDVVVHSQYRFSLHEATGGEPAPTAVRMSLRFQVRVQPPHMHTIDAIA